MAAQRKARDFSYLVAGEPRVANTDAAAAAAAAAEDADEAADDSTSEMARLMGFSGFGAQEQEDRHERAQQAALLAHTRRGSDDGAAPTDLRRKEKEDGGDDDRDDEDDEDDDEEDEGEERDEGVLGVPISHEIELKHSDHPVVALSVDPAGARVVTGATDYTVKFWDFNGMDTRLRAFRSFEPFEGYPVRDLAFSATGDRILVCTGSASVKVVDRDGMELLETKKGDAYLFDLARTAGHVSSVNSGCWHPRNGSLFMTCSNDSTVRVWDVANANKSLLIGKCRSRTGKRMQALCCTYNSEGKMIAVGTEGGAIHLFRCSEKILLPKAQIYDAHAADSEVTSVAFSRDQRRLISRATDGTLKSWDVFSPQKPTHVASDLPCYFNKTECIFSPDERFVLTGTSGSAEDFHGALVILRADTLEKAYQVGISGRGVIRVQWHMRINQILLGCSNGTTKVLFDAKKSQKGATLCATRQARKQDPLDRIFGDRVGTVLNPHSLKAFAQDNIQERYTARRRKEKARADPVKSRRPEPPVAGDRGVGKGGRAMGFTSSLSQYIAKRTSFDATRDQDPRAEILKFANAAEANPFYVGKAYEQTQPQPVYDLSELPEEEEDNEPKKRKFDPKVRPKKY